MNEETKTNWPRYVVLGQAKDIYLVWDRENLELVEEWMDLIDARNLAYHLNDRRGF